MPGVGFLDRVNRDYFDGGLPAPFLTELAVMPTDRPDVQAFIERMFRFMSHAGIPARDLSLVQGQILGSLLARILPGAWAGRVPPITLKGRHRRIDCLIQRTRYRAGQGPGTLFDLGCGFPPDTTLDSADALAGWTIHASDPNVPAWVVYEPEGAYASFDAAGRMLYCQPSVPTLESWDALVADLDATADRFRRVREGFGDVPAGRHERADGSRLVVDPIRLLERPGLTFGVGGIGQVPIADVDVARCFNVLYYFADDFNQQALEWFASTLAEGGILLTGGDWAFTTECRYFLHQRLDGRLHAREFGFSLDNVVPLSVVPFYALHDDSRELAMLFRLVRTLRQDAPFLARYYEVVDTLRAGHGICQRLDDGCYGSVGEVTDPVDLWTQVANLSDQIAQELGRDAVAVLERAGWEARLDEIGCVAVSLASVPPEA